MEKNRVKGGLIMRKKDLKKYLIHQECRLMAYNSMLYEINYTFEIIDAWYIKYVIGTLEVKY